MASINRSSLLLEPSIVVRDTLDARILLGLWCARKAFIPALLAGLIVAGSWFLIIDHDPVTFTERMADITNPAEVSSALLSPFALVAFSVAARVIVALAALAAAYPLSTGNAPIDYPETGRIGRYLRTWWDRWQMVHAYRAYRWTWGVHGAVLDRLGARGSMWEKWDRLMVILSIVFAIAFFVLLTLIAAQTPVIDTTT